MAPNRKSIPGTGNNWFPTHLDFDTIWHKFKRDKKGPYASGQIKICDHRSGKYAIVDVRINELEGMLKFLKGKRLNIYPVVSVGKVRQTKESCLFAGGGGGGGGGGRGTTATASVQYEPDQGPGLNFDKPNFNWNFKSMPGKSGTNSSPSPSGGSRKPPPPPRPPDPCDEPDANCGGGEGGSTGNSSPCSPEPEAADYCFRVRTCDDEVESDNYCPDDTDDDTDDDTEADPEGGGEIYVRTLGPNMGVDYSSTALTKEELKEAWAKVRNKSNEIKRTAGPSNSNGGPIDPDDLWARTWGPLVRPTNPGLDDDFTGDLSTEEVLRIAFGAAPIDPAGPDGGIMSGPRPRPEDVLPSSDPKAAGTTRAAFAPGQPKANALNQMEDEWR